MAIQKVCTQIAERFVDTGDFLIFEAFNEIHDGDWGWGANLTDNGRQYGLLNEWLQIFVDAVRSTGGKNATRYLGIPGYAGGWEQIEHLEIPKDPTIGRMLVSVHCYSPGKFCQEFYDEGGNWTYLPEWGHTATEGKYPADDVDEEGLADIFRGLKARFTDNNIPVYIGEFTCTNRPSGRGPDFRADTTILITSARRLTTADSRRYSGITTDRAWEQDRVLSSIGRQAR